MKKLITLGKVSRLANSEPFLLPDKLELEFNSIGYNLTSAFITLKNGEIKDTYKLTQPFIVPDKFLFAGALNLEIKAYMGGNLLKRWSVLPIKIVEVDDGIECFDLVSSLETKIEDLTERMVKLENKHKSLL